MNTQQTNGEPCMWGGLANWGKTDACPPQARSPNLFSTEASASPVAALVAQVPAALATSNQCRPLPPKAAHPPPPLNALQFTGASTLHFPHHPHLCTSLSGWRSTHRKHPYLGDVVKSLRTHISLSVNHTVFPSQVKNHSICASK